jgi:hypothetical protein
MWPASGTMSTRPTYLALATPVTPAFPFDLISPLSPHTQAVHDSLPYTQTLAPLEPARWSIRGAIGAFVAANGGLLLVVVSQAFYASMNVAVKTLNSLEPPVPPIELIMVRMIITYVCCVSYM